MKDSPEKMLAIIDSLLAGSILLAIIIASICYGFGVVTSGSMEPAIRKNDLILVRKTGGYKVGDIVVYESGDNMIVHRIIDIDDSTVTTCGDANNVADEPIDPEGIKGVVVASILNIPGYPGQGLKSRFVTRASGSSRAEVAGWEVSALAEDPDTLQVMAGNSEYSEDGYEFTVYSDSDTTAEYHIDISLLGEDEGAYGGDLTLGLFMYGGDPGSWYQVAESSGGLLEYEDILPIGHTETKYKLKALAAETEAGNYEARINVDVTQID